MTRSHALAAFAVIGVATAGCAGSSAAPQSSQTPNPAASTPSSGGKAAPSPSPPTDYQTPPPHLPAWGVELSTGPAPWPAPALVNDGADSADYVAAAGLPYGEETTTVHYHVHVDINVDGDPIKVAQYLGFVAENQKLIGLSALHTHDDTGIVHIENATPAEFVLGQVFVQWGVRFTDQCLGSYCTGDGKELAVFVDGKRYTQDPTRLVLEAHQEIAIEYGDAGDLPTPPSSYDFPSGL